jgi:hypothetical protein
MGGKAPTGTKDGGKELLLHENLTLLEVEDPEHLAAIEGIPEVRSAVIRRLTPTSVALDPDRIEAMLAALERKGLLPRIEDGS